MSAARGQFLESIVGLNEALALESLAGGATRAVISPGLLVLRRGILVAALIALETFIRSRTTELLQQLGRWPATFEDLPQRLRDASTLNALPNLQRYAAMLKRQDEDYESELGSELLKMASRRGASQEFTKFVAGDFTGNISEESIKALLLTFQVSNCWETFRIFSSDIGFGVPSVRELIKDVVRKRHRSAHSAGYAPTAADISGLSANLFCLAICFDVSATSSVEQALASWRQWANGDCEWRDGIDLYFIDANNRQYKLLKHGRARALRVVDTVLDAKSLIPRAQPGRIAIVVNRDLAGKPADWTIL